MFFTSSNNVYLIYGGVILNIKDNRRVVMTKKIIKDTFIEMLEKKNIQKIYVRELCEKADINRSTFYKYYESQYDLLAEMENDLLMEIEEKCMDKDDVKGLNNILCFLNDNKKMYRVIFNANIDPNFSKKLLNLPIITEILNNKMMYKTETKYKKTYILEGGYNVILEWLNNNCKEDAKEITDVLMKCINQNLK